MCVCEVKSCVCVAHCNVYSHIPLSPSPITCAIFLLSAPSIASNAAQIQVFPFLLEVKQGQESALSAFPIHFYSFLYFFTSLHKSWVSYAPWIFFLRKVFLCRSGYPRTHQDPPTSAPWVLELKVCARIKGVCHHTRFTSIYSDISQLQ